MASRPLVIEEPPRLTVEVLAGVRLSVEDRALVGNVVEVLDAIEAFGQEHPVAPWWTVGVAAAVRAVLGPHRPAGPCRECGQAWPCGIWRTAHRWLIELDAATGGPYEWV